MTYNHSVGCPDFIWEQAQKVFGKENPSSDLRDLWYRWAAGQDFTEHTELAEPMEIIEPPETKPVLDWSEFGMGYEVDDPDFTKKILPWWIEQWDSEEAAFARVKMKSENGVREPRRWVSNLYYKALREAVG